MNNCKLCGEPTPTRFCCIDHRQKYYHTEIVDHRTCVNCGKEFGVTTNTRLRDFCRAPACVAESRRRGAAAKAEAARAEANRPPQQVRATYCVTHNLGPPVRCKHHLEPSCRYRVKAGRPVCRVEPDNVDPPSYYQPSLAGAATILAMIR